jgi:hypothetical protein
MSFQRKRDLEILANAADASSAARLLSSGDAAPKLSSRSSILITKHDEQDKHIHTVPYAASKARSTFKVSSVSSPGAAAAATSTTIIIKTSNNKDNHKQKEAAKHQGRVVVPVLIKEAAKEGKEGSKRASLPDAASKKAAAAAAASSGGDASSGATFKASSTDGDAAAGGGGSAPAAAATPADNTNEETVMSHLPHRIKSLFRQVGFAKLGRDAKPVLFLSPFDLPPDTPLIRDGWNRHYQRYVKGKARNRMVHLELWYGGNTNTTTKNTRTAPSSELFGVVSDKSVTSYGEGEILGHHRIPGRIEKKIRNMARLTPSDKALLSGLKDMQSDRQLPPAQRWTRRSQLLTAPSTAASAAERAVATATPLSAPADGGARLPTPVAPAAAQAKAKPVIKPHENRTCTASPPAGSPLSSAARTKQAQAALRPGRTKGARVSPLQPPREAAATDMPSATIPRSSTATADVAAAEESGASAGQETDAINRHEQSSNCYSDEEGRDQANAMARDGVSAPSTTTTTSPEWTVRWEASISGLPKTPRKVHMHDSSSFAAAAQDQHARHDGHGRGKIRQMPRQQEQHLQYYGMAGMPARGASAEPQSRPPSLPAVLARPSSFSERRSASLFPLHQQQQDRVRMRATTEVHQLYGPHELQQHPREEGRSNDNTTGSHCYYASRPSQSVIDMSPPATRPIIVYEPIGPPPQHQGYVRMSNPQQGQIGRNSNSKNHQLASRLSPSFAMTTSTSGSADGRTSAETPSTYVIYAYPPSAQDQAHTQPASQAPPPTGHSKSYPHTHTPPSSQAHTSTYPPSSVHHAHVRYPSQARAHAQENAHAQGHPQGRAQGHAQTQRYVHPSPSQYQQMQASSYPSSAPAKPNARCPSQAHAPAHPKAQQSAESHDILMHHASVFLSSAPAPANPHSHHSQIQAAYPSQNVRAHAHHSFHQTHAAHPSPAHVPGRAPAHAYANAHTHQSSPAHNVYYVEQPTSPWPPLPPTTNHCCADGRASKQRNSSNNDMQMLIHPDQYHCHYPEEEQEDVEEAAVAAPPLAPSPPSAPASSRDSGTACIQPRPPYQNQMDDDDQVLATTGRNIPGALPLGSDGCNAQSRADGGTYSAPVAKLASAVSDQRLNNEAHPQSEKSIIANHNNSNSYVSLISPQESKEEEEESHNDDEEHDDADSDSTPTSPTRNKRSRQALTLTSTTKQQGNGCGQPAFAMDGMVYLQAASIIRQHQQQLMSAATTISSKEHQHKEPSCSASASAIKKDAATTLSSDNKVKTATVQLQLQSKIFFNSNIPKRKKSPANDQPHLANTSSCAAKHNAAKSSTGLCPSLTRTSAMSVAAPTVQDTASGAATALRLTRGTITGEISTMSSVGTLGVGRDKVVSTNVALASTAMAKCSNGVIIPRAIIYAVEESKDSRDPGTSAPSPTLAASSEASQPIITPPHGQEQGAQTTKKMEDIPNITPAAPPAPPAAAVQEAPIATPAKTQQKRKRLPSPKHVLMSKYYNIIMTPRPTIAPHKERNKDKEGIVFHREENPSLASSSEEATMSKQVPSGNMDTIISPRVVLKNVNAPINTRQATTDPGATSSSGAILPRHQCPPSESYTDLNHMRDDDAVREEEDHNILMVDNNHGSKLLPVFTELLSLPPSSSPDKRQKITATSSPNAWMLDDDNHHDHVILRLNVSGKLYAVSRSVTKSFSHSLLDQMLSKAEEEQHQHQREDGKGFTESPSQQAYFIDRDGERFSYVLDYLRYGVVFLPKPLSRQMLLLDLKYFEIPVELHNVQFDELL